MTTMNRNKKAIDRIVQRLSREWQKDAGSAISRLYDLLDSGKRTSEAISVVRSEYPKLFTLTNIRPALVEAAAYGYGIVPSVLTSTQKNAWSEALAKPWDAGGLTLSKKLHGADVKMREAIADTIRDQMNRNAAWTDASLALYDGYGKGNVVRTQELPKYLSAVRYATKGSPEALKNARRAIANIEQLARKGSPTKALKASYQQLIDAAENGTAEELEKVCRVAIEEKSRYVAQRIIRTETARAYADGFVAKMDADDDVVAVRLRLSTRHPVFDICDFFANADMYGLGKGVYPKDKAPPIPLHPHCMCRFEEVYAWEVDISKQRDKVKQAGDRWLSGLSARERREVLGIEGDKAWQDGESWEKYLRNWKGLAKPETRLTNLMSKNLVPPTDEYIKTLADKQGLVYTLGKKGNERFYADDGSPIYPPNDGFVGEPKTVILTKGYKVDRYGRRNGSFVSPVGVSFEQRALPRNVNQDNYHVYELREDLKDVLAGKATAWFGQPGGGSQYKLPDKIGNLEDVLEEVSEK